MIIQPNARLPAAHTSGNWTVAQPVSAAPQAQNTDTVTISQAAREALATAKAGTSFASSSVANAVEARLAEIKSKDAMSRTPAEMDYVFANDTKLAELTDKENRNIALTSSEVDYVQKARGFVNTMALLSPAEKGLYDKLVASGDTAAAAGISVIAFTRTLGHTAGGANGTTYDPINTAITAANIEKYFSHSIVDPSGKTQSQLQALLQYLQNNPAAG